MGLAFFVVYGVHVILRERSPRPKDLYHVVQDSLARSYVSALLSLVQSPHGRKHPCYTYEARLTLKGASQSGLAGFSRLRMNSRGIYSPA